MDESLRINYLVNSFDADVLAEDVRREAKTWRSGDRNSAKLFISGGVSISGEAGDISSRSLFAFGRQKAGGKLKQRCPNEPRPGSTPSSDCLVLGLPP
jgi:hypothetical protein